MSGRSGILRLVWGALIMVAPLGCAAATLGVRPDGGGEMPTIQAALDAAAVGDVIVLADGTYTGPGNRDLDFGGKAITLRSAAGDAAACVIDCAGEQWESPHRAFHFRSGETAAAQVVGVTMINGQATGEDDAGAGGAVLCQGASPTFHGCVFRGNQAERGGALAGRDSAPTLVGCVFERNTAEHGGAVHLAGGTARLTDCRLDNNSARQGGAMLIRQARPVLARCRLSDNLAHYGGGLHGDGSDIALDDCWLERNVAAIGGGLFVVGSTLRLAYTTLVVNTAGSGGGVTATRGSALSLDHVVAAFNQQGGAVALDPASRVEAACSLIFGNAEGDWTGPLAPLESAHGNLWTDPGFTAPGRGDFSLGPDSPCRVDRPGCGPLVRP